MVQSRGLMAAPGRLAGQRCAPLGMPGLTPAGRQAAWPCQISPGVGEAGAYLLCSPCSPGCSAASQPELLSLELFVCLFIAQVLLKIIGLGQTHLWH